MKPSEVSIQWPDPLAEAFGSVGIGTAVALLVLTCAALGDEWQAVNWFEVRDMCMTHDESSPLGVAIRTESKWPTWEATMAAGIAKLDHEEKAMGLRLTPKGMDILNRQVPREGR